MSAMPMIGEGTRAALFRGQIFRAHSHADALEKALNHFVDLGEDEQAVVEEMDTDTNVRFGYMRFPDDKDWSTCLEHERVFKPVEEDPKDDWRTVPEEFSYNGKKVETVAEQKRKAERDALWAQFK